MKQIFTFLICLTAFVTPRFSTPPLSPHILVEQEAVVMTVALPDWGKACTKIPVYSKPDPNSSILRYADAGETLRIRSGNKDNTFAMVAVVEWVRTTDLCKAGD